MLNRRTELENAQALCPSLHVALQNSYSHPSHLYIGNSTILSQNGTTQGEPLAMAVYGIAILPLISRLHNDSLTQKWYADDGNVVGKLKYIKAFFDKLTQLGPKYGYLVNPPKCQLIIKPGSERQTSTEFAGTNVEITQGARVLGSVIGSSEASKNFLKDAEIKYRKSLDRLGQFALTSLQNAYACLANGVQQKLSFLSRTTPSMDGLLDKVEERLGRVIPNIVGKEIIQDERTFSLALRMGGLNIALPQDLHKNLEKSIELSTPLASLNNYSFEIQQCELEQTKISLRQKADMQRELISKKSRIENNLPEMKYTIQLASKKGVSSWLNALPLLKHGFDLTKTEFRDGIALRYTWEAKNTPAICPCGKEFSLTHALHCAKSGHTYLRHNEIRDVFANLMDDVCHDAQIEPKLQCHDREIFSSNSTTTDDDARLNIKANGLWGSNFNRTFFEVKIFNPHAKSCPKTIKDAYKYQESIK